MTTDLNAIRDKELADALAPLEAKLAGVNVMLQQALDADELDRTKIVTIQAQLDAEIAEFAAYQKEHPETLPTPVAPRALYGATTGGVQGETLQAAYTRIDSAFGGLMAWRCWPNTGFPNLTSCVPSFVAKSVVPVVELSGNPAQIAAGNLDAVIIACLKSADPLRPETIVTLNHEADLQIIRGTYSLADHLVAQAHFGKLVAANAPKNVKNALILEGGCFIPSRNTPQLWEAYWPKDRTGIHYMGADCYQHGKSDTNCETASTVLGPVIAASKKYNLPIVLGEIGTRNNQYLSDQARAKYLTDFVALLHTANVRVAMYFESWHGTIGPWNILDISPGAAAVWKAAIAAAKK